MVHFGTEIAAQFNRNLHIPHTGGINVSLLGSTHTISWNPDHNGLIINALPMYPFEFPCNYACIFKI